jgi:hypothetical protein
MNGDMWFACMRCGARAALGGACAACGDDPLLDLRDPASRELLSDEDDRRRSQLENRRRILCTAAAVVAMGLPCLLSSDVATFVLHLAPLFLGPIAGAGILFLSLFVLSKAIWPWRPRYPYLRDLA